MDVAHGLTNNLTNKKYQQIPKCVHLEYYVDVKCPKYNHMDNPHGHGQSSSWTWTIPKLSCYNYYA